MSDTHVKKGARSSILYRGVGALSLAGATMLGFAAPSSAAEVPEASPSVENTTDTSFGTVSTGNPGMGVEDLLLANSSKPDDLLTTQISTGQLTGNSAAVMDPKKDTTAVGGPGTEGYVPTPESVAEKAVAEAEADPTVTSTKAPEAPVQAVVPAVEAPKAEAPVTVVDGPVAETVVDAPVGAVVPAVEAPKTEAPAGNGTGAETPETPETGAETPGTPADEGTTPTTPTTPAPGETTPPVTNPDDPKPGEDTTKPDKQTDPKIQVGKDAKHDKDGKVTGDVDYKDQKEGVPVELTKKNEETPFKVSGFKEGDKVTLKIKYKNLEEYPDLQEAIRVRDSEGNVIDPSTIKADKDGNVYFTFNASQMEAGEYTIEATTGADTEDEADDKKATVDVKVGEDPDFTNNGPLDFQLQNPNDTSSLKAGGYKPGDKILLTARDADGNIVQLVDRNGNPSNSLVAVADEDGNVSYVIQLPPGFPIGKTLDIVANTGDDEPGYPVAKTSIRTSLISTTDPVDPGDPGNPGGGGTPQPGPGNPKPDPGNPNPGNPDPGNPNPGNPDPGNPGPITPQPGDPDPGNPGNPDPGNPGNPDPGNPGDGDINPGNPGNGDGNTNPGNPGNGDGNTNPGNPGDGDTNPVAPGDGNDGDSDGNADNGVTVQNASRVDSAGDNDSGASGGSIIDRIRDLLTGGRDNDTPGTSENRGATEEETPFSDPTSAAVRIGVVKDTGEDGNRGFSFNTENDGKDSSVAFGNKFKDQKSRPTADATDSSSSDRDESREGNVNADGIDSVGALVNGQNGPLIAIMSGLAAGAVAVSLIVLSRKRGSVKGDTNRRGMEGL